MVLMSSMVMLSLIIVHMVRRWWGCGAYIGGVYGNDDGEGDDDEDGGDAGDGHTVESDMA